MRFSQAQEASDGQSIPAAPGASVSASRPLQSMGAFDAYGGAVVGDSTTTSDSQAPRNATPKRYRSSDVQILERRPVVPEEQEDRDQESSVCSETDTDAETDDEPTIRPAHSCASSDTQSLFSNDASEDGVDGDDYGDGGLPRDSQHSVRHHHRWSSAASSVDSSVDGDRLMASP